MRDSNKSKIWIMGGSNMDVCGVATQELIDFDSNIGEITVRPGGVGRNIAEVCSLLYDNVGLITVFGNDSYGQYLIDDCKALGLDCSCSVITDKYPTPMYMAIMDESGDMRVAMNDMKALEELNSYNLDKALSQIGPKDILILDTNLSQSTLEYVIDSSPSLIALDPVSISKIDRIGEHIGDFDIFKPNKYEAETLTGIYVQDEDSAKRSLSWFLDRGVKEIIITLSDEGVLLGTTANSYWIKHRNINLANATGGGDAFLGAYVVSRMAGRDPLDSAKVGISASIQKIENKNNIREFINWDSTINSIKSCDIEEMII